MNSGTIYGKICAMVVFIVQKYVCGREASWAPGGVQRAVYRANLGQICAKHTL